MRLDALIVSLLLIIPTVCRGEAKVSIPNDFPRFKVPGSEKEMESLRQLYWLHYPGSGPKATLWDEWLSGPGLWPDVITDDLSDGMRKSWSNVLSNRIIDSDGYVATHQHASIAHQLGWPFPFWNQGSGVGWHFSFKDTVGTPWRQEKANTQEGWTLSGVADEGIGEDGWNIQLTEKNACIASPAPHIDTYQAPFLQLRWKSEGLDSAQPYIEWTTDAKTSFSLERRVYFDPAEGNSITYTMIPMYKHPEWTGEVSNVRICFGNIASGVKVTVQAFFTQYDTRHNINSQNFVRGCCEYFWWTGDLSFLRHNINRMRDAIRYVMTEHKTLEKKVVYTDWVGHDGRCGIVRKSDGTKEILSGHGIGSNYWDLLPFGNLDAYATIHYYDSLNYLAKLEREILEHPEWNVPGGVRAFKPDYLLKHAAEVKAEGNRLFWNPETGRFVPGVDADGKIHDYGLTFVNLEAICYGFATPEHAKSIMSWIGGNRVVNDDTAQGVDIYHWRFGPRATTKRNLEYYSWVWSGPESIPWGGQVQDGGAVLGFTYHDLMSRLNISGPDNAWVRLKEIISWFDEVQAAGGYRAYYNGSHDGTLQGGGAAGGLGLDYEFFESVLVPQIMINGFLGFSPTGDGFSMNPRLPSGWPELSIDRIRLHDLVLSVRVNKTAIEVMKDGPSDLPCFVHLPEGKWTAAYIGADGKTGPAQMLEKRAGDGAYKLDWASAAGVRFEKK